MLKRRFGIRRLKGVNRNCDVHACVMTDVPSGARQYDFGSYELGDFRGCTGGYPSVVLRLRMAVTPLISRRLCLVETSLRGFGSFVPLVRVAGG